MGNARPLAVLMALKTVKRRIKIAEALRALNAITTKDALSIRIAILIFAVEAVVMTSVSTPTGAETALRQQGVTLEIPIVNGPLPACQVVVHYGKNKEVLELERCALLLKAVLFPDIPSCWVLAGTVLIAAMARKPFNEGKP